MADDIFYFAYGSNLNSDQKEDRTGPIREARRARLLGYRFAFNKRAFKGGVYANIVPDEGSTVWGVVYRCKPETLDHMDIPEGVKDGHYIRYPVRVVLDDGQELDATTYVAGPAYVCPEGNPEAAYLNRIILGARAHRLPEDYIAAMLVPMS